MFTYLVYAANRLLFSWYCQYCIRITELLGGWNFNPSLKNIIVKADSYIFAVFDSDDTVLSKLCGNITVIAPIFSSSNFMTIIFKTDNSRNYSGFKASWSSLEVEGSIIKSPNSPLFYPSYANEVKWINRNLIIDINCFYLVRHGPLMSMKERE